MEQRPCHGSSRGKLAAAGVGALLLWSSACVLDTASRARCQSQEDCLAGHCCIKGECYRGACGDLLDAGGADSDGGPLGPGLVIPGARRPCTNRCVGGIGECAVHEICSASGWCQPRCDVYTCAEERLNCYLQCDTSSYFQTCVDPAINVQLCHNVPAELEPDSDPEGPFIVDATATRPPAADLGCANLLHYALLVYSDAELALLDHTEASPAVLLFDVWGAERSVHQPLGGDPVFAVEPLDAGSWQIRVAVCEEDAGLHLDNIYTAFVRDLEGRWSNGLCFLQLWFGLDEVVFQQAVSLFEAEEYAAAIAAFEEFVATWPTSSRVDNARVLIALCHFRLDQYTVARQLLVEFLVGYPESVHVEEASLLLARCDYELEDYHQAIFGFSEFLAAYPESEFVDAARYFLGRSHYELDEFESALAQFEQLLEDGPYRERALLFAGQSEFQLGALDDNPASLHLNRAESHLEQLLAEYPDGPYADNAAYFHGMCAYERELYELALARLEAARATYEESSYRDNMWFFIGHCHTLLGDYASALIEFEGFLAVPDYADSGYIDDVSYFAGRCHYELAPDAPDSEAAYRRAIAYFDVVIERYPDSKTVDNAFYFRGLSHYATAALGAALTDFQAVVDRYPSSPYRDNAYFYLIRTHIDLGDCDSARSAYAALAADYPGSEYASSAEEELARC